MANGKWLIQIFDLKIDWLRSHGREPFYGLYCDKTQTISIWHISVLHLLRQMIAQIECEDLFSVVNTINGCRKRESEMNRPSAIYKVGSFLSLSLSLFFTVLSQFN